MARRTFCKDGSAMDSSSSAYGIGTSAPVTLCTGASSQSNASSITIALISDATPKCGHPDSKMTSLFVFVTDLRIVWRSNGLIERKLMT